MGVKRELEPERIHILVDCCARERTYERFYGLLCEPFCRLKREFQMANAEEYIDGTNAGALGEILIRCNNILYIGGAEDSGG
ncbi:unnamed protein product, partial [Mesorhabditis belari]|uniref:Sm domain-containing protein n=1 Tax=Mesorhabditis belari TaxID=2138241 RepID=A0AAF3EQ81_9BILA